MAITKITSRVIESGAIDSTHLASGAITSDHLTGITTDNVTEGSTNLYYTNARVDTEIESYLSGGTGVTYSSGDISIGQDVSTTATPTFGNITTTGYIAGPSTLTLDPAGVGDNTGTVVIAGNLQVDGTTTTINSTTMTVDDLNITLASGAANAAAANGAGLTIDGANAQFTYDGNNDRWSIDRNLLVTSSTQQNLDINFVNTRANTADRVRLKLEANSEDWHLENDQNLNLFKIRHHTNDRDVITLDNSARANSITANSTGVGINVASAGADLHVDRVIRVSGTTSAVQIGDTNGYTFFYTGNTTNRFQLNYDAPFGSGVNVLFTADSSGRVVYHDQLQLAADYNTAVNTLANQSYFYVGSSSKSYNISMESSRDITSADGEWASQNEIFIVNTHSGGEASIGMSALSTGGQHHRAALIARPEGTGSLGTFVVKTRGSSAAESEKERLVILPAGEVEITSTKAYGSTAGSLRIRPSYTGTNYSDGAHINIVFGREDITNNYIGEIKVEQLDPSASTASNMQFYTNSGGGNGATAPRMTVMSNGGVEVGDGTNYGYLKVISNSAPAAYFDRRGSDGTLLQFRHDDVNPIDGQINTLSGRIGIGSGDTGIFFDSVRDCLSPFDMTTNDGRGSAIDIGRDAVRFRDGYFSGLVDASRLAATNTADSTGLSFRSANEFISGEGWCTAHGHYNYNDGTLFLNRDTVDALHPVFHIGGYNNVSYHPSFSYSSGDAGMVTLVRPNGVKSTGTGSAYQGLSTSGDYSNWIKDSSGTWFFDSDSKHQFYGNVDVRQSLAVNSDKSGNEYLYLFQAVGGDGGILWADATGGSRLNWQMVPSTSSRTLLLYSYTMGAHHTHFNAAGGIHSLSDGGSSSAFFLAGNSTAAANGKVAMGLRDGMIQFRDPGDYYHKMWYYDGINVSTNQGHGHFRVWGDSGNSAMNNTSAEDTMRFSIDTVTGNIGTSDGATNIYNASDERLKENVTTLPSMLSKINALRPISFDWKYKEGETGIYGFIAQEVQEVDESLVFNSGPTGYRNDKTYGEDLELDGNIEDTLAINERKLFPMLVKAIQEQQTIIDDLTARLEALEG